MISDADLIKAAKTARNPAQLRKLVFRRSKRTPQPWPSPKARRPPHAGKAMRQGRHPAVKEEGGEGRMSDLFTPPATKPAKAKKITSSDIHIAMAEKWGGPEWAIMWEVGEATGAYSGRYADAVMMSLWPSRGLELHGVEIKVSRSDWKREAADPQKAEAVAKYCDRWWIHTPPSVVSDLSELPPAWGLREFDGKAWKTIREAEKTEAAPVGRKFLAALLRRAEGISRQMISDGIEKAREKEAEAAVKLREQYHEDVERAAERKTQMYAGMAEKVVKLEAAFGKDVLSNWLCDPERLGKIARAIEGAGMVGAHTSLALTAKQLREAAAKVDAALAFFNPEAAPDA